VKGAVYTSVRINNLLEDTLGVGNVIVLSGFVGNQCMEGKVGWRS